MALHWASDIQDKMDEKTAPNSNGSADPPRRGFFRKFTVVALGVLAVAPPLAAGVATWLDPLRGSKGKGGDDDQSGGGDFIEVTTLAALPNDGIPRKFKVIADLHDAWTTKKDVPIGSVYLRRHADDSVEALNATCPHASCEVNVAEGKRFSCPCHDSDFELNGALMPKTHTGKNSVSPRGLDTLDVKVEGGGVWVKFQNFYTGIPEKRAKA